MTAGTGATGAADVTVVTAEARAELERELRRELKGELAVDDYSRHLFASDASMYAIMPLGVVFPRDRDDVEATVTLAARHGVPVTARGAGTSLAGQTTGAGLIVDLSRHLNRIHELDTDTGTALVDVGVVQDQLNAAAAPHGWMFGPDTSTSNRATLGGMIGNNSAGSGSLRYGMTIDHVRALDVVLADGSTARFEPVGAEQAGRRARPDTLEGRIYRGLPEIARRHAASIAGDFPDFWRRAGGYRLDRLATHGGSAGGSDGGIDLATFVVGSEGTLAVATRARVGLVRKPAHLAFAVGHFGTVLDALAATGDALACGPTQVELMDRTILELSRRSVEYADLSGYLHGDPGALLFVSFTGDDERELRAGVDRLVALWERHGHGYHTMRADTPAQQAALLKVRKSSLGLLMAASTGTRRPLAFVEDTAVDPLRLAEYTRRFAEVLERNGLTAGFYGHASVGCLHIRPFVDVADPDQVARMRAVAVEIRELVAEFGGANSSEHGDGLARSEFNREIFGEDLYAAMCEVKELFDPAGTLNPGKVVHAPAMTSHLRDAERPAPRPVRTTLDFSVVGGMHAAADRCMNIGICRKTDAGVMCPSYIATRDEEHSTRGRANALVKALGEPDPAAALAGDERLHEILDLCLMCKACKSECPLSVDLASLKAEALSQHHAAHGVPVRSRLFAAIRTLNRLGAATAPVSNALPRLPGVRRVLDRAVGITPRRPLPKFSRQTLPRWAARRTGAPPTAPRGAVTFLADSFTSYTEPQIGRAAVELLELAGWRVRVEAGGCCGRASLSKGMLTDARRKADRLLTALGADAAGQPVVGCEPSCLFTLRDEYAALLPADSRVAEVAERVRQVEELLVEAIDDGSLVLRPDSWLAGRTLLYHGHCHQKAEVGTAATLELLRRIPGVSVTEIDGGCCGMAGSFGFESEHYEMSMTVGGDRLFPTVRAAPDDTVVVATGVSCRQQILHGTSRGALHPLELVRSAAGPAPSPGGPAGPP